MPPLDKVPRLIALPGGWLTLQEAARLAGVSVTKFRALVTSGEIPTAFDHKTRHRVVHRFAVDAWVQAHQVKPGSLAHLDSNLPKYRKGRAH